MNGKIVLMQMRIIKEIWPNEREKCPPSNEQTYPPQIGDKVIHFDGRKGVINRIVKILSLSTDKIGFFECHIKEV